LDEALRDNPMRIRIFISGSLFMELKRRLLSIQVWKGKIKRIVFLIPQLMINDLLPMVVIHYPEIVARLQKLNRQED